METKRDATYWFILLFGLLFLLAVIFGITAGNVGAAEMLQTQVTTVEWTGQGAITLACEGDIATIHMVASRGGNATLLGGTLFYRLNTGEEGFVSSEEHEAAALHFYVRSSEPIVFLEWAYAELEHEGELGNTQLVISDGRCEAPTAIKLAAYEATNEEEFTPLMAAVIIVLAVLIMVTAMTFLGDPPAGNGPEV